MTIRTHATLSTTATAVSARAPMSSWSHAATSGVAWPVNTTGFGTKGMYGIKRPARHLDERLT
jgi:hypothetical protein